MGDVTMLDWTDAELLSMGSGRPLPIKVHAHVREGERVCAADLDVAAVESDTLGPTFVSIRYVNGTDVKVATRVLTMLGRRSLWRGQEHFLVATFHESPALLARWWSRS